MHHSKHKISLVDATIIMRLATILEHCKNQYLVLFSNTNVQTSLENKTYLIGNQNCEI